MSFHKRFNLTKVGQWLWLSGRAVASDTRDPRFKSSHRQTFIEHLFTVNCVEKTKIKKKRPGMAHLKKLNQSYSNLFAHHPLK